MDEVIIVESHSLREKLCSQANLKILNQIGQLEILSQSSYATYEQVANYYQVSESTLRSTVKRHKDEFISDGYKLLSIKEFRALHNATLKNSKSRYIALFTRKAVLRAGMVLRDSLVAKKIRTYLLNAENKMIAHCENQSLAKMAAELEDHAVQLAKNADQLITQAGIIKAVVNEVYLNRENIKDIDRRVSALETMVYVGKPQEAIADDYVTQEQIEILKKKVKQLGHPARAVS